MNMNGSVKKKLRPVLDGDDWMIGDNPDLGVLQGKRNLDAGIIPGKGNQECVDHHIFQSVDGVWHLWGCIRGTAIGRLLYHWEAKNLMDVHWTKTGEFIRVDKSAGESIDDLRGKEVIQSPYVIRENGLFYMFYGGYSTGLCKTNMPEAIPGVRIPECQMCLMTSEDGRKWDRHKNSAGESRIFFSPGEVRDPCLIKIGGVWHMYYTGHENIGDKVLPGFYARTSGDLINWSAYRLVHRDCSSKFGSGCWNTECPHVVEQGGYFYMFRTEDYFKARTHVFRSLDPFDFGIDNAADKYVGMINVAAPEFIIDGDGQEYITSNHDLDGGTRLCRLKWIEEK